VQKQLGYFSINEAVSARREKYLKKISLTRSEISKLLNITDPFLFLDRVDGLIPGSTARGHLRLKRRDWFFKSHLPEEEAMPASLLTEAMLQALVLTLYTKTDHAGKPSFIIDIQVKLLMKVRPGMSIVIETKLTSHKRGISRGEARIFYKDNLVCSGQFVYVSPHEMPRPKLTVGS